MVEITHGHYRYIIGSKYSLGTLIKNKILTNKILKFFQEVLYITVDYRGVNAFVNRLRPFDYYFKAFEFEFAEILPQDLVSELMTNNFLHFYVGVIDINFFNYDFNLGFETIIEIFDEEVYLFIQ